MIHLTLRDLRTLRPTVTQPTVSQAKDRRPKRQSAGQPARTQILPRRATYRSASGAPASATQ